MIRVAFAPGQWLGWLGGVNYLRNLLRAIRTAPQSRLEPTLFVGERTDARLLNEFPPLPVVRSAIFDRPSPAWAVRAAGRRALGRDLPFERLLRAKEMVALSHHSQVWRAPGIAMLGFIADFQHRRLPTLFSGWERRQRDRTYARICRHSTLTIVSSECARTDLGAFDSEAASRARVLRFVADPPPDRELPSRSELVSHYGIEGDYFHVPNQFWSHKNYLLVLEALGMLRDRGIRPLVVATGETRDYRRPGYFELLIARARELRVQDRFQPLGVVPYSHVAGLMRHAIAVINPSRFEGWSTAVEEAKSLGKRVLVSGIDVHREQDPPGAVFFDPSNAEELAEAMWRSWVERDPVEDARLERDAQQALPARKLEFAQTYEGIVVEGLEISARTG